MPEGDSYVAHGDLLRCDKGVLVTPLTVLPRPSNVHGRYQATTADCVPLVNVMPFGVCAVTHGPCLPPTLLWTQAHPGGRLVGGAPPLLESSVCRCALGGNIGITVLPVPGMAPVGAEAPGALAMAREQQRQQAAQDAAAHELANHAKEQAGKLALLGIACAIGGLFFPPLELVAVVALEASEAYLVAGVAIDVAVAIDHPTQDNWVTVGGDALAIATGYVVGKVIIGPAMGALANKLAQRTSQKLAAEAVTDAEAAVTAEAKLAAEKQVAAREAELLRQLEQKPSRAPRPARPATSHQQAKINQLRKQYRVDKDQNIAYTEGRIDGKPYEKVSHSGHKKDRLGTVEHTPVEQQQLGTHPTKTDYEKAARQGKEVDPTRRAHDSETKILEDLLRKTTPSSKGNIILTSERPVCESCAGAIEQFRVLRPGIRIRVSHAVTK